MATRRKLAKPTYSVIPGGAQSGRSLGWRAVIRVIGGSILLEIIGGKVLMAPEVARRLAAALLVAAERADCNEN